MEGRCEGLDLRDWDKKLKRGDSGAKEQQSGLVPGFLNPYLVKRAGLEGVGAYIRGAIGEKQKRESMS